MFEFRPYKDNVKTHQEARFEDNLKKRLNKREQRQKLHLVQTDSSKKEDSSAQTANNTNIHFQSHNNVMAQNFIGMNTFLK